MAAGCPREFTLMQPLPTDSFLQERPILPFSTLPRSTLPAPPILPVDRENPPRTLPHVSGRRSIHPTPPPTGDFVTYHSFGSKLTRGVSAEHGAVHPVGRSRCGIARLGRRPIA